MNNKGRLDNKIAVITGASRGIGRATALLFAREGAKVVVNYKSQKDKATEVLHEIYAINSLQNTSTKRLKNASSLQTDTQSQRMTRFKTSKHGGRGGAVLVQADVSKEVDVKRLIEETLKAFGRIDILVNNAGEIGERGWTIGTDAWTHTLDVNLTSAWLMIREVVPIMKKQGSGSIVNLASTVGLLGVARIIAYSCAKGGIVSMTKGFAKELAPEIRVNAVAPSNVKTDMTKSAGPELIEFFRTQTPLARIAEPEELAQAILFLASDDASYITGHTLVVDGGYSLK